MHGLRVYNDTGILQIDSKYKNMRLTGSGTAVATTSWIGFSRYVDVNVVGVNPILAFNHSVGISCAPIAKSGSTYTFRLFTYADPQGRNDTINYWVFDSIDNPTAASYGLQVFNESGSVCYDSSEKYFRVLQGRILSNTPIDHPGKTVLVAPCIFGYFVFWTLSPNLLNWIRHEGLVWAKVTGTTPVVFSGNTTFSSGSPSPGDDHSNGGRFAALDFTGY